VIKLKIIPDFKGNARIVEEIIKDCQLKWGDEAVFLRPLLLKGEAIGIATKENSIVAFSVATKIIFPKYLSIAFFATRVLSEFRNQGLATNLIKKITRSFILRYKFCNFSHWFKPVYFVTATANPIVFENFRKYLKTSTCMGNRQPREVELKIAQEFAALFSAKEKFNAEKFILKGAFLNSAEFYRREEDIPWSNNEKTNAFLEERISLKEKTGDGIVVIGKIL